MGAGRGCRRCGGPVPAGRRPPRHRHAARPGQDDSVNSAYSNELFVPATAAELKPKGACLVRQIEACFRKHKVARARSNHFKPSRTYLREQESLPVLDATTLDRIEKLFQRLTSLIRTAKGQVFLKLDDDRGCGRRQALRGAGLPMPCRGSRARAQAEPHELPSLEAGVDPR